VSSNVEPPAGAFPFVGRSRELAELEAVLKRMLSGRGQVLLISGEPGIGKTRIAEELTALATTNGVRAVWSQCYEWDGAPAYWPWIQLIRGIVRDQPADQVHGDLNDQPEVAQLVPEIRQHPPGLSHTQVSEPEQNRFRLFDSVATFFTRAAVQQPTLLIIDDLHWADASSLQLLQFIAQTIRSAPLLVLGTFRNRDVGARHPLTATMAELARQPNSHRINLRALSQPAIAEYIEAVMGEDVPEALAETIFARTDGNPFFVAEVVRSLEMSHETGALAERLRVPESVRDMIHQRLERLTPETRQVLATAAVIGREFGLSLLAKTCELPAEQVGEMLDEAARAGIVESLNTPGSLRFRFGHALTQEAICEDLPPVALQRLHLRIANTIEAERRTGRTDVIAILAHHFLQSAALGTVDKSIRYATEAADLAMQQLAWESAVDLCQRAVQTVEHIGDCDAEALCRLHLTLGEATDKAHLDRRTRPDRSAFVRAAELARQTGSDELFARAALGFAGIETEGTLGELPQVRLLEEALERLDPGDSALRARLLARLATDSWCTAIRTGEAIRSLSDDADAMARRIGDPAALAYVLTLRQSPTWKPESLEERLAETAELVQQRTEAGDPHIAAWGVMYHWMWLMEAGDTEGAEQALTIFASHADRSRIPLLQWATDVMRGSHALVAGRFGDAEARNNLAHERWPENLVQHFTHLVQLHAARGQLDQISTELRDEFSARFRDPFRPAFALFAKVQLLWIDVAEGRLDAARQSFDALAEDEFSFLDQTHYFYLGCLAMLADACAALGDRDRARILLDRLRPYADRNLSGGNAGIYFGAGAHYIGLLATTLSDWGTATEAFNTALDIHERMGARPSLARTRCGFADMLLQRNEPGDLERAADLLGMARAAANELEMTPIVERATSLLAQVPSEAVGEANVIEQRRLTRRELEILRLIVAGRSNQQNSDELFLSVRTVERHIANIYYKLGVHNRVEATAFALRHHLA